MGLFSLALVALLALTGVRGADVDLGQTCTTSDNCVHPTLQLACDFLEADTTRTCLIQAGEACSSEVDKYCVSGATCSAGTCTCTAAVYTASSGLCSAAANKWSGACDSGACAEATLECNSGLSECVCVADTLVVLSTGLCTAAIANTQVGKACTDSDKDTTCGTSSNLECPSGGGKCACSAGYVGSVGDSCSAMAANGKSGKICTDSDKATTCGATATTFLECPSGGGVCACQTGYTGVTGSACYPAKGQLNGGCSGTGQGTCSADTMECTGTGAKACKSKLLGACTADADCTSTTTMVCDTLTNKCLIQVGQVCTDNTANCRSGAKCTGTSGTTCECDTAISTVSGEVCTPKSGYVGGSCTVDGDCGSGATCTGTGSTCACTGGPSSVVPSTLQCSACGITASVLVLLLMGVISQLLVSQ